MLEKTPLRADGRLQEQIDMVEARLRRAPAGPVGCPATVAVFQDVCRQWRLSTHRDRAGVIAAQKLVEQSLERQLGVQADLLPDLHRHLEHHANVTIAQGCVEEEEELVASLDAFAPHPQIVRALVRLLIDRDGAIQILNTARRRLVSLVKDLTEQRFLAVAERERPFLIVLCEFHALNRPVDLLGAICTDIGADLHAVAIVLRHIAAHYRVLLSLFPIQLPLKQPEHCTELQQSQKRHGQIVWLVAGETAEITCTVDVKPFYRADVTLRPASGLAGAPDRPDALILDPHHTPIAGANMVGLAALGLCFPAARAELDAAALPEPIVLSPAGNDWSNAPASTQLVHRVETNPDWVSRHPHRAYRLISDLLSCAPAINRLFAVAAPKLVVLGYEERPDSRSDIVQRVVSELARRSLVARRQHWSTNILGPAKINRAIALAAHDALIIAALTASRAVFCYDRPNVSSLRSEAWTVPEHIPLAVLNFDQLGGEVAGLALLEILVRKGRAGGRIRWALDHYELILRTTGTLLAAVEAALSAAQAEAATRPLLSELTTLKEAAQAVASDSRLAKSFVHDELWRFDAAGPLGIGLEMSAKQPEPSDRLREYAERLLEFAKAIGPSPGELYKRSIFKGLVWWICGRRTRRETVGAELVRYQNILQLTPDHSPDLMRRFAVFGAASFRTLAFLRDETTDGSWGETRERASEAIKAVESKRSEVRAALDRSLVARALAEVESSLPVTSHEIRYRLAALQGDAVAPADAWRALEGIVTAIELDASWDRAMRS